MLGDLLFTGPRLSFSEDTGRPIGDRLHSDVTRFKVSVAKEYLSFSSAHFITLAGHQCESLHGHNYRVGVTVEGPVDPECAFVVDFAPDVPAGRGPRSTARHASCEFVLPSAFLPTLRYGPRPADAPAALGTRRAGWTAEG